MRLTSFSDYALRILMLAASRPDRLITIDEAARTYRISRAHLMKVVNELTRGGYLLAVRGRAGGLKLGKPAEEIRLGDVLRLTEPDFALVECFCTDNHCVVTPRCRLKLVLNDALDDFMARLDRFTLRDLTFSPSFIEALAPPPETPIV